jgi:gluconolactonase
MSVQRLDPALDKIVSPDARLELLKGDYFGFLEGPVWVPEGSSGFLLFSDIPANAIYKWTSSGELSMFLQRSGFTGTDTSNAGVELNNGRLQVILLGSNGLTLDRQGRVVFCAHGDRAIVRLEKDGTRTTLADRYEGKRLNSPNDLVMRSDGALYFTDPSFGLRGVEKSPLKELSFNGVFLLKDGKLQLLDKDPQGAAPNGIAFSPDERYLYVGGGRRITRYQAHPDGSITNGQVFVDMSADKAAGGADGMKVDRNGNVYSTGPGGVWIISPEGKHLGTILVPAANLAFGDADSKTLYLTARRDLYRIRVNIPGIRP